MSEVPMYRFRTKRKHPEPFQGLLRERLRPKSDLSCLPCAMFARLRLNSRLGGLGGKLGSVAGELRAKPGEGFVPSRGGFATCARCRADCSSHTSLLGYLADKKLHPPLELP